MGIPMSLSSTSGGSADGLRVVASFYPLQYVAQRVDGDHAEVQSLTSPGKEPHDAELTVRQTAEVAQAAIRTAAMLLSFMGFLCVFGCAAYCPAVTRNLMTTSSATMLVSFHTPSPMV